MNAGTVRTAWNSYRALAAMLARSVLREPVGAFFSLAFAPILLLLLGFVLGNEPAPHFGGVGYVDAALPAFSSIVLATTGVMLVPTSRLGLRASGATRRLFVTPLRPSVYVAAELSVFFVIGLAGVVLAFLAGVLVFGVPVPQQPFVVLGAVGLGLAAFLAFGHTLAELMPSTAAATGLGNVLMIALMFSSGAFVPVQAMSEPMRRVSEFSPVRHYVDLVRSGWDGGVAEPGVSIAVLFGMGLVFGALGTLLFHRRLARGAA